MLYLFFREDLKPRRQKVISEEFWPVLTDKIQDRYEQIMKNEERLAKTWKQEFGCPSAKEMYGIAIQILDTARLGLVPRSYNSRYGWFKGKYAPESVGAHTNLMLAIFARAVRYKYGSDFEGIGGYTFQELYEAVQRHDLAEVITGDIPDNGNRDEASKTFNELVYAHCFAEKSPERDIDFDKNVQNILHEMAEKSTTTGRLLFVTDKAAALIVTLCYDKAKIELLMKRNSRKASSRDRAEMKKCDYSLHGACFASEMWAIDYFEERRLIDYDDTGYITALIVMCTLLVNNGEWYSWREKSYIN